MRKLKLIEYVTLDGVMEDPGATTTQKGVTRRTYGKR